MTSPDTNVLIEGLKALDNPFATYFHPDFQHSKVKALVIAGAAELTRLQADNAVLQERVREFDAAMTDDPNWVCAGIPDIVIDAGVAAWDAAEEDMKPENYIAGETADWDEGMIVAAIFKAMARALTSESST